MMVFISYCAGSLCRHGMSEWMNYLFCTVVPNGWDLEVDSFNPQTTILWLVGCRPPRAAKLALTVGIWKCCSAAFLAFAIRIVIFGTPSPNEDHCTFNNKVDDVVGLQMNKLEEAVLDLPSSSVRPSNGRKYKKSKGSRQVWIWEGVFIDIVVECIMIFVAFAPKFVPAAISATSVCSLCSSLLKSSLDKEDSILVLWCQKLIKTHPPSLRVRKISQIQLLLAQLLCHRTE